MIFCCCYSEKVFFRNRVKSELLFVTNKLLCMRELPRLSHSNSLNQLRHRKPESTRTPS